MQVRFLGHAGFEVTGPSGARLVMDPWLSGEGAFLRSWFPFPDNSFIAADVLAGLDPKRDALYLSHHHRDHFDPAFLRKLPRELPVVVPRFVRRHLRRELDEIGFVRIIELDHGDAHAFADLNVRLFLDESFAVEDSAILVESRLGSFLNMNDCRANDRLTRDDVGAVDILSMQFSGASWYPSVYDYPAEERDRRIAAKNRTKFENVVEFLRRLAPRFYLPAAGPPCFLDPQLRPLNRAEPSAFPRESEFLPLVTRSGIATRSFLPGDTVVLDGDGAISTPVDARRFDASLLANPEAYLDHYARQRAARHPLVESPADQLDRLEQSLRDKLGHLREALEVDHRLCVSLIERPADPAGHLVVDLRARECSRVAEPPTAPQYHIQVTNETMAAFFETHAQWEDLLLSLRFKASRDPDVHVSAITDFLRLEASDLDRYPPATSDERIVVEYAGQHFEIDRYCPHQGGDLRLAAIDAEGILRCPRHGWEFDLTAGGRCLLGNASICARPAPRPPAAR